MQLHVKYDADVSAIIQKIVFSCDDFFLSRENVFAFKEKKLLKFVKGDDFPEEVGCQVLVQCETYNTAKIIFFNPNLQLPKEIFDEYFLNKDLIDRSERHGFFWLEVMVALDDECIELHFSYDNE